MQYNTISSLDFKLEQNQQSNWDCLESESLMIWFLGPHCLSLLATHDPGKSLHRGKSMLLHVQLSTNYELGCLLCVENIVHYTLLKKIISWKTAFNFFSVCESTALLKLYLLIYVVNYIRNCDNIDFKTLKTGLVSSFVKENADPF